MGCELTKLMDTQRDSVTDKAEDKEAVVRTTSATQADERKEVVGTTLTTATDSGVPLSAKQKYCIIASWKAIRRSMEPTGVYMFVKLFEQNRELLDLFEKFQALKGADCAAGNLELAEHATIVMSSLDESLKSLDDLDNFLQFLQQIGQTHRKIPGFKPEYFWRIVDPFLEAVKTTLGDRYTENMESIYKTTIIFIIKTLVESYEMTGPTANSNLSHD